MSLFLELIVIAMPIAFQLVLDDVIVADDRSLLVLIVLGLGLILGFRALVDFIRSWCIMAAGATIDAAVENEPVQAPAAIAAELL